MNLKLLCNHCGIVLSIAQSCPDCKSQDMKLGVTPHHDLHEETKITHKLVATETIKELLPDIMLLLQKIEDMEEISDYCLLTMPIDDFTKLANVKEAAEEIKKHLKKLDCSI
jgi:geranylgeranyl pyrophosphate synthase